MTDAIADDLAALLPPLLQSIDALDIIARRLYPPEFGAVMNAVGTPDAALRAEATRLERWPDETGPVRDQLLIAIGAVVKGFDGLRAAPGEPDGIRALFRALRYPPRAKEALYPLAAASSLISRFFLPVAMRDDAALLARIQATAGEGGGVTHVANDLRQRGGYSLYVPEYLARDTPSPVIVAMHGGSGHGRNFLWSWLRDARAHGAILIAPTAVGPTWALMGEDADTPNLGRILDEVAREWMLDPARMLLTGLSDGGTFCYVSGLEEASRFTHLAPVAAAFHPLMAQTAPPQRMRGLPVHIIHGVLDWMFPVQVARDARDALAMAGADVTYRELDDLSHTYPAEMNAELLAWVDETRKM